MGCHPSEEGLISRVKETSLRTFAFMMGRCTLLPSWTRTVLHFSAWQLQALTRTRPSTLSSLLEKCSGRSS